MGDTLINTEWFELERATKGNWKPRRPDCIMSRLADAVRSLLLGLATTTTTTWWRGAEPDLKLALVAGAVEGSGWRAQAARAARARDARILRSWGARIRTASGLGLILYLHQVKDMWGPDRNVSLRWLCQFILNPFFQIFQKSKSECSGSWYVTPSWLQSLSILWQTRTSELGGNSAGPSLLLPPYLTGGGAGLVRQCGSAGRPRRAGDCCRQLWQSCWRDRNCP